MARIGISEQQLIEAAEQLLEEGQAVTVSAVRDLIGSGSFSTINAYLAKWKEAGDRTRPGDVPDMPESVARAMRQLWAAAWKEAQDGIKAEWDALEAARRDMERERRDMANEINRLEAENAMQGDEITRLGAALTERSVALGAAEKTAHGLKIENARLDERAKAAEGRAGELREELAKLHAIFKEDTTRKQTPTKVKTSRKTPGPSQKN